jgi:hypothetical protein
LDLEKEKRAEEDGQGKEPILKETGRLPLIITHINSDLSGRMIPLFYLLTLLPITFPMSSSFTKVTPEACKYPKCSAIIPAIFT